MQIERIHGKGSGSRWVKSWGPLASLVGLRTEAWHSVFPAPPSVSLTPSPGHFISVPWNSLALMEMKASLVELPIGAALREGHVAHGDQEHCGSCGEHGGVLKSPLSKRKLVTSFPQSHPGPLNVRASLSFRGVVSFLFHRGPDTPQNGAATPVSASSTSARTSEGHIQTEDPGRAGAPTTPSRAWPPKGKVTPTRDLCGQLCACAEAAHSNPNSPEARASP